MEMLVRVLWLVRAFSLTHYLICHNLQGLHTGQLTCFPTFPAQLKSYIPLRNIVKPAHSLSPHVMYKAATDDPTHYSTITLKSYL